MNIEKLRKKVTGGFEPFAVCTSDGREYKVPHPEFIRLTARDVVVFESSGDGIMLDPLHIVSLRTYAQRQT